MTSAATQQQAPSLTDKALAVCAWHYGNAGSGCGRCPIQSACHGPDGLIGRLTNESLAAWQGRVNAAAEKVSL